MVPSPNSQNHDATINPGSVESENCTCNGVHPIFGEADIQTFGCPLAINDCVMMKEEINQIREFLFRINPVSMSLVFIGGLLLYNNIAAFS